MGEPKEGRERVSPTKCWYDKHCTEVFHPCFCHYNEFHISTLDRGSSLRSGTRVFLERKVILIVSHRHNSVGGSEGEGNLHISHQDKEKCRLFSALTFPHKRPHHWEELGWCRSGNVSAILYHNEHCRLTTLSRKTSLHSLRDKNGEERKKKERGFYWLPTMCKPLCQVLWAEHPGMKRWYRVPLIAPLWGNSRPHLIFPLIYSSVTGRT
jgi:hypothetical protein